MNPLGNGSRRAPRPGVCDRSPSMELSTGVSWVAHSVARQKNPSRDCTLVSPRCRTAERPWGSGPTTNRLAGVVMAVLPFISLLLLGFSGACGGGYGVALLGGCSRSPAGSRVESEQFVD